MDAVYLIQYQSTEKGTWITKTFVGSTAFTTYTQAEEYLFSRGYLIDLEMDSDVSAHFISDTPYYIMSAVILKRTVKRQS